MADRFKFRVWDGAEYVETIMDDCYIKYDGKLICGAYFDDGYVGRYDNYADSEVIIEQCTGLKDKNGELIYQGDIVKTEWFNKVSIFQVVWNNSMACFIFDSKCSFETFDDLPPDEVEVIGNIHENPELLENLNNG